MEIHRLIHVYFYCPNYAQCIKWSMLPQNLISSPPQVVNGCSQCNSNPSSFHPISTDISLHPFKDLWKAAKICWNMQPVTDDLPHGTCYTTFKENMWSCFSL
ncbi:hypothetical protein Dimus_039386 [Dionaea muscipula]